MIINIFFDVIGHWEKVKSDFTNDYSLFPIVDHIDAVIFQNTAVQIFE